jgi:hypothetical protein
LEHASPCGQAAPVTNDQSSCLALRPGSRSVSVDSLNHLASRPDNASSQLPTSTPCLAARYVRQRVLAVHATSPCGQVTLQVNCQPAHPALRRSTSVGGVGLSRHSTLRPSDALGQLPIPGKPSGDDRRRVDNGSAFAHNVPCGRVHVSANPGLHCRRTCWAPFHGFQPVTLARLWIGCVWSGRHPLPSK